MMKFKEILDEEAYLEIDNIDAKYNIKKIEGSPCRIACPAGVNVKAYLGLIAAGKYYQALEAVKRANPLPGICGRVCTFPCEIDCRRSEIDGHVFIRALKRFIADYEYEHINNYPAKPTKIKSNTLKKRSVAIIGSGPAGLTAANDLIRKGYDVTIFEALPVAGGMLAVGIPSYRLPGKIIQTEIDLISNLGVKIKKNTTIKNIEQLLETGFDAVFAAIGAHKSLKLNIHDENEFSGVLDCLSFLKEVSLGRKEKPGNKVVIIGGGNAAIDSARTSIRLGVEDVRIVYRRSRNEMPAYESEIKDAEEEGVLLNYLVSPIRILGKYNHVTGLECIKMRLGDPDESGRRNPIPIPGTEFVIETDVVISAISQKPDLSFLPSKHNFKVTKHETFEVDPKTLRTNIDGIFAGGDAVTGAKTVIDAIQSGHIAARSIDNFLHGRNLKFDISRDLESELKINLAYNFLIEDDRKLTDVPKISLERRKAAFDEVELGLTIEQATREAKRCLRCGPCLECWECSSECSKKLYVINRKDSNDDLILRVHRVPGYLPETAKPWHGYLCTKNDKIPVKIESIISEVQQKFCRACGKCSEICEYNAISMIDKSGVIVAIIDPNICRGCGTCTAICPSNAIISNYYTISWIHESIENSFKEKQE